MSSSYAPSPIGDSMSVATALGCEDVADLSEKPKLEDVQRAHAPRRRT